MANNLVQLVEACDIKQRRNKHSWNVNQAKLYKKEIKKLERSSAVKMYLFKINRLNHLLETGNKKDIFEIRMLRKEIGTLENHYGVMKYKRFNDELLIFEEFIKKYYICINVILRNELLNYDIPDIFVYQGQVDGYDLYRNILVPNSVKLGLDKEDQVIYPDRELKSNREYRKFYNRVSFRYIEDLTRDYSYDLEGKKLRKVKIEKH